MVHREALRHPPPLVPIYCGELTEAAALRPEGGLFVGRVVARMADEI